MLRELVTTQCYHLHSSRQAQRILGGTQRYQESRRSWIDEALSTLGEREQIIIRERRLTDEGLTLEELGSRFGVSKERVRQLEQRALCRLKDHMTNCVAEPLDLLHE